MILIKVCLSVITGLVVVHRVACQNKPTINTTSQTFLTALGGNVLLPCIVKNLGNKQVIWTFVDHGTVVSKGREVKVQTNTNKYSIQHPQDSVDAIWNLLIVNIQQTDVGHYKCHVDGEADVSVTHLVRLPGGTSPTVPPSNNVSDDFNVTDCCMKENVTSACLPVCHPRSIANPLSFNATAFCAFDILKLLKCGSDNKNHAGCCKRRGVPDLCLDYCLGQLPATITTDHDKCLNNIMDIIACYEDGRGYLPGPPSTVSAVYIIDSKGILVTWSPPTDNTNLVIGYRVFYKTQEDALYTSTEVLPVNKSESYMIPSVLSDTTYTMYVISVGNNGASQPSVKYELVTITGTNPDSGQQLVKDCCVEKGVSDGCLDTLCSTNRLYNIDPTIVMNCYPDINNALQCVTGQRDSSACCKRNGLPEHCLPLCSGKVPELSWNYTSCVLRLQIIDACVQEGMATIPGPPVNITLTVGTTYATVTWQPAPGANATSYIVVYNELDRKHLELDAVEIFGSNEAVIDGLIPGTHYELTVSASNDKGSSLPSTRIIFLTYELIFTTSAPSPTPAGQMPNYNETACCVQKRVSSKCLPLCTYSSLTGDFSSMTSLGLECMEELDEIIACAADGRDHTECCLRSNIPTDCLSFCKFNHGDTLDISHLSCLPNTALIANCYREGVVSLPKPPQNLTVLSVTAHTVTLRWQQPDTSQVGISSYQILYTSDFNKAWEVASTSSTTYIVNNLKPNTPYFAEVISVNANGTSVSSPRINFYTMSYGDDTCNFTKYSNIDVADKGEDFGNTTLEKCRQACEQTSIFSPCVGFVYSNRGQCIHYTDKIVFSRKLSVNGSDLYVKNCSGFQLQNMTTDTNWTVTWHNRSDCCMKNNVSSGCMPYCKSGDFSNPNMCVNDLNALLACATDGRNHTACCQGGGVPSPCLPLCAGHPMEKDALTALCLSYVGVLLTCFTEGMGKIPTPPLSFQVVDIGTNYISLSWTKSVNNCDTDCIYKVMILQANGSMITAMNGTRETSYKYTGLSQSTTYLLSVVAINKFGSSLPAISLAVTTKGSSDVDIVIKQDPGTPKAYGSVEMICEVYGPGQYKVTWYFNNKMIGEGRQLTLHTLTAEQEGVYTCFAKDNALGKTYNETRFLQIKYKPKVVNIQGDSQVVNNKNVGTLSCEFYGVPDQVTWLKDGQDVNTLKTSFRSSIENIPQPNTGKMKSVLSIYFVSDKSVGDYTCVGTNTFGNGTGHMKLTNLYPTQNPPTVPVPGVRNVTQCCRNSKMSETCLEICKYDIDISMVVLDTQKYGECLASLSVYVSCATDGKDHSKCCSKTGVSDKCKSLCAGGGYPGSEQELLDCLPDVPQILNCVQEGVEHLPSPPQNVNARIDSDNFIQVFWDAPLDNANNLTHYVLYVNRTGYPSGTLSYSLDRNKRSYKIKDAKEGDEFQFYVIAESSEGNSQPSNVKNFTFKDVKPAQVKGFSIKVINGNNVQLNWLVPENKAIVSKYIILYGPSKGSKIKVTEANNVTKVMLNNLQPDTLYDFSITAYGYGRSPLASESVTQTRILIGHSSSAGTGKQTGDGRSSGSRANVGLAIGLTVLILFLVGGAAVATFLYFRRQRKRNPSQAVSFENPQYGSRVQISGLPDSQHDDAYQDESFGYAPLREETDVDHSPTKAHEAAKLDLNQAS